MEVWSSGKSMALPATRRSFANRMARTAAGQPAKLGTFAGVFVPTALNVLSILMFLRFGFILGQGGVLGMMGMLLACYLINLITTMSISAIASNGVVRNGGAYYLVSRALGPEFGGSIGIVLYLGFTLNTGMNAAGLVDCFVQVFGQQDGNWSNWLPDDWGWRYLWATTVLVLCTAVCLAGSAIFAKCSNGLLVVLFIATYSIPISTLFKHPFENPRLGIEYTGLSYATFRENLLPHFTTHAAGSHLEGRENWQDLFGILFPATGGIFAGASMSGDLRNPSHSIPKGTLYGLFVTFVTYSFVIFSMAGSITRDSFHRNINVLQDVNLSGSLILVGEVATCLFSVLMGVIGSAKLLQALARDSLLPGLTRFGYGSKMRDEPYQAIVFTYLVAQLAMLSDINSIASLVTMAYLATFLVTNLSCFLLRISSAPNFRPSFHYFNEWTAALGTVISVAAMFFVDSAYASACLAVIAVLFITIHYTSTPKSWGDVSQGLIYHQVRKYLLRLRKEHVKFWRPQLLLLVNDPRRSYKLVQFCNSLKKGSIFILGHVIATSDFAGAVSEAKRQQEAWTKYIELSKIKAFVNVAISPAVEWGARNAVLNAGLGGLRPNIIVLGIYNLDEYRNSRPLVKGVVPTPLAGASANNASRKPQRRRTVDETMEGALPTDTNRNEKAISPQSYVTVLEDLLLQLKTTVAVAKGFGELELPPAKMSAYQRVRSLLGLAAFKNHREKKNIDLWPIQMSAEIPAESSSSGHSVLTTNFDTYTLVLQLGCILHSVSEWKGAFQLRVNVFVENEEDVEEEYGRVETLLMSLRIEAEIHVFWLNCGKLQAYEIIARGNVSSENVQILDKVEAALESEEWWSSVKDIRSQQEPETDALHSSSQGISLSPNERQLDDVFNTTMSHDSSNVDEGYKALYTVKHRPSISDLSKMGLNPSMVTSRLDLELLDDPIPTVSPAPSTIDDSDEEDAITAPNGVETYDEYRGFYGSKVGATPKNAPQCENMAVNTSCSAEPGCYGQRGKISDSKGHASGAEGVDDDQNQRRGRNETVRSERPTYRLKVNQQSFPKLSSALVPRAQLATEEGVGPSIMFSSASPPARHGRSPFRSIYKREADSLDAGNQDVVPNLYRGRSASTASRASSVNAVSVSGSAKDYLPFNMLPSRAQHLIINELMRKHSGPVINYSDSEDEEATLQGKPHQYGTTAVIFTTLPAPAAGTHQSEEESLKYLIDLETLCSGLPPVMLLQSNSMSVTTSL